MFALQDAMVVDVPEHKGQDMRDWPAICAIPTPRGWWFKKEQN